MIANGSFEDADVGGRAAGWTTSFVSSAEEWAEFAQNPGDAATLAHEGFEAGWGPSGSLAFLPAFRGLSIDLLAAIFAKGPAQSPTEGFQRGWGPVFLPALMTAELAVFDGGFAQIDGFEVWGPGATVSGFLEMPFTEAAPFGANAVEDFETGWGTIFADFAGVPSGTTDFGIETFESVAPPERVIANAVTNELTLAAATTIPILQWAPVQLMTTEELPSPWQEGELYFVTSISSSTTFRLTSVSGGPPMDISDEGAGEHYVLRNPGQWWTRLLPV